MPIQNLQSCGMCTLTSDAVSLGDAAMTSLGHQNNENPWSMRASAQTESQTGITQCWNARPHRIHVWYIYIYANMWGILMVNVTIYSIHGSCGDMKTNRRSRKSRHRPRLANGFLSSVRPARWAAFFHRGRGWKIKATASLCQDRPGCNGIQDRPGRPVVPWPTVLVWYWICLFLGHNLIYLNIIYYWI